MTQLSVTDTGHQFKHGRQANPGDCLALVQPGSRYSSKLSNS